jgi:hypothetical protein
MDSEKRTAVVFLMWLPYGIEYLERFARSYQTFHPGYPHQLVLLFNGTSLVNDYESFLSSAKKLFSDFEILELEKGQDIDAYFYAASKRREEYILFLNTFSEFRAGNWLKFYHDAFREDVGIVGATGSYQSLLTTTLKENPWHWQKDAGIKQNVRKYKLLLKTYSIRRFLLKKFPNPHIRTNAFMVKRNLFLKMKHWKLKKKFDAYLFENGKESLTNQVISAGLKPVIIDKHGNSYEIDKWKESHTFWNGDQENLLVSDNQTDLYQKANNDYKQTLRQNAWGE